MDLNSIPLMSMLVKRMAWLNQRQTVLAQNVANANTPQYKPRDLKPLDFDSLARHAAARLTLVTTNPGHLRATVAMGGSSPTMRRRTLETSPTGNAVNLEEEMMKIGRNRMEYDLAVTLYRKHVALLRVALGGRGR
jgi:flagellar basal-body rod protein FlgB